MPRDRRLYMTFPIDFDEHPKIVPLSDAAFRTFVAMNGYSRRNDLDGRIPVKTAKSKWRPRALTELVESHPERPLVLIDGDVYVIRDYAEHQFTTEDLDDLRAKRAEAGAKGGRAKAVALAKQRSSKPLASAKAKGQQTVSKPVAEIRDQGSMTDMTNEIQVSHELYVDGVPTDPEIASLAKFAGIKNLEQLQTAFFRCCGPISARGTVELAQTICSRAKNTVTKVDGYVLTAIQSTPDEVRYDYERLDLGAIA